MFMKFLSGCLVATIAVFATPSWAAVDYDGLSRAYPQVIAAGISPSQVDWYDTEFEVVAIIRPGMSPLHQVSFQDTGGFIAMKMKLAGVLENGDEVYRFAYAKPNNLGNMTFETAWGSAPGQFNIIAIGKDKIRCEDTVRPYDGGNAKNVGCHTFPHLRVDHMPAITPPREVIKSPMAMSYNSTRRYAPQVIMAGYTPAILRVGDDQFDLIAIVRPGTLPIESVTLKQNENALFSYVMYEAGGLDNGDKIYKMTYTYPPGALGHPPEGFFISHKDLWGPRAMQFGIEALDEGGLRSHKFPNIEFGTFPDPDNPR